MRVLKDPRGGTRVSGDGLPDVADLVETRRERSVQAATKDGPGIRKQISLFVALDDWRTLRQLAARRGCKMTELIRPGLTRLIDALRAELAQERDGPE